MNEETIQEHHRNITTLLEQKRLKEAQSRLETLLLNSGDSPSLNRLEQLQTAYRYMLQYMRQRINDPDRQKLYLRLLAETGELADRTRLSLLDEISGHYYHALRKNRNKLSGQYDITGLQRVLESIPDDKAVCRLMPDNQGLDAVLKRHEETIRVLFLTTWSNSAWTEKDERQANGLLESELLPVNDLCLFTGALTLSLMECFDARKFTWLLNAVTHADTRVNQRALVGIALVLHLYPTRLALYPEPAAHLSLLNEDGGFGRQLNRVYIQLLRSQETEKIDKKMQEEIIPEMIRNVSIMRNMKFEFEENPTEENDLNPDWEKAFEQSGLGEKIREISEWQLEGSDVYMSTFSQLKRYPFFEEPHNWFYPFDIQHSTLIKEFGLKPVGEHVILSLILQSGFFCDSDKYSLCFTMAHIPPAQREMMLSQMTSQDLNELIEESKSTGLRQYAERPEVESNRYIHDLYRFFKLSQRKLEFRDIFREEIMLHHVPALKEILRKPELMRAAADFRFCKQHYAEALDMYQELISWHRADADIFQKAGYCLQKEKRYKEAVNAYGKADVLKPDHVWVIRHLAICYRQMKDFESALEYYKKAEAIQPENRSILFHAGSCLAELDRQEEALRYFFKLDFMENNDIKTWRAIGWCSFASGKYGQAMKYYQKILAAGPLAADYLNSGHVAWLSGKLEEAVEFYGKAASESGDKEVFREMFATDKEALVKQGIDEKEIPLMLDLVFEPSSS